MTHSTIARGSFDCPVCGAHADNVSITLEAEVVEVRPVIELWEGGPVVEDIAALPEFKAGNQTLTTDACACSFSMKRWDMVLNQYPDGHGELLLTRRA